MAFDETTLKTIRLTDDKGVEEGNAEARRMSGLSIDSSVEGDSDVELTSDDDDVKAGNYRGRQRQTTKKRDRWLARSWQMKKEQCGRDNNCSGSSRNKKAINDHEDQCRVLVKTRGPDSGSICMDLDEIKACRELGIELPWDWTVEIPCEFSGIDTSSGGNSRISSPGDDPKDVKARLKVWAQAVALASASSLSRWSN